MGAIRELDNSTIIGDSVLADICRMKQFADFYKLGSRNMQKNYLLKLSNFRERIMRDGTPQEKLFIIGIETRQYCTALMTKRTRKAVDIRLVRR